MKAAASSCRTWTKRILSLRVRSASMMPLMPSPGRPKITSTPQAWRVSTSTSAALLFPIAASSSSVGRRSLAGRRGRWIFGRAQLVHRAEEARRFRIAEVEVLPGHGVGPARSGPEQPEGAHGEALQERGGADVVLGDDEAGAVLLD